jgi:DNA-directed RNA polymerase specialized sigma24 family protein
MEAFEALATAFGGLDHDEKRFLILRYWENLTWEQVASAMGITAPQAKGIDQRLRQRLRRDLVRQGVDHTPPDF